MDGWRRSFDQPSFPVFVATVTERIVGFISPRALRDDWADKDRDGEVSTMYVLPEFQGKGLGAALWSRAISELRAKGFSSVFVWVLDGNQPAIKFYESRGCKVTDRKKAAFLVVLK